MLPREVVENRGEVKERLESVGATKAFDHRDTIARQVATTNIPTMVAARRRHGRDRPAQDHAVELQQRAGECVACDAGRREYRGDRTLERRRGLGADNE